MSIKVVHGIIGEARKDPTQTSQIQNQTQNSTQLAHSSVASGQVSQLVTNEAVSISVRNSRASISTDRIKDFKVAREVADNVAEKVRTYEDSAGEAHTGLSETTGRSHLA